MSFQPLASLAKSKKWKMPHHTKIALCVGSLLALSFASVIVGEFTPKDPGVRGVSIDSGLPLASVATTPGAAEFFADGLGRFTAVEVVTGQPSNIGLGPRFNSNQCSSCHSQPAVGGSSPSAHIFPSVGPNPETLVYNLNGAKNTLPSFITPDGPVREVRFKYFLDTGGGGDGRRSRAERGGPGGTPDGGVHDLFVITGRGDARGCELQQPDFESNLEQNNVIFRIPTPVFGAGLMENIPEEAIVANYNANQQQKAALGISGHPNRDGNDGMIARFGWKAQNKSLELFAGEAYNVEMGVTNEIFQNERASPGEAGFPGSCLFNSTPEDTSNFVVTANRDVATQNAQVPSDTVQFAMFMRLLAPPKPATSFPGASVSSIADGSQLFGSTGCVLCHTPTLTTWKSTFTADLSLKPANLFSDLLVHHMGTNLADGVSQGGAGPDEFRSAPLWGLGQRIFLLHDGRSTDLIDAIRQHASSGSEANGVINNFNRLNPEQQQDLLNFLRSL
jgi:CxxC motif-containing protein (DUF1111 family)